MECPWRGKDRCGRFRTRRCSSRGAQSPSDRFPDSARVCGCRHFATRREFNTGSLLLKSPAVLRARSLQKLSVPLVVGGVVSRRPASRTRATLLSFAGSDSHLEPRGLWLAAGAIGGGVDRVARRADAPRL